MTYLIITALIIMLASLSGVVSVSRHLGVFIERNLSVLVSFSAGVFCIINFTLISETLAHSTSLLSGLLWIVGGALGIFVIFRILPTFHHHHDAHEEHDHHHSRIDTRRIIFSDALHNIGDGILLAAAFTISIPLGIAAAASIFIHEIVQEISEFFVLKQAGFTTAQALTLNFAISSTILIGAIGGFVALDYFTHIEIPFLGIAAGALLVVILHDLIPHSVRTSRHTNMYAKHIGAFLLGIALMYTTTALTDSGHDHSTHDDEVGVHDDDGYEHDDEHE